MNIIMIPDPRNYDDIGLRAYRDVSGYKVYSRVVEELLMKLPQLKSQQSFESRKRFK